MEAFPEKTSMQPSEQCKEDLLPLWAEAPDVLGAQMVCGEGEGLPSYLCSFCPMWVLTQPFLNGYAFLLLSPGTLRFQLPQPLTRTHAFVKDLPLQEPLGLWFRTRPASLASSIPAKISSYRFPSSPTFRQVTIMELCRSIGVNLLNPFP